MDKEMTVKEMKSMVGTEFMYHYAEDDYIKAYVKAFDINIGLTCFTLETETSKGWVSPKTEDDGTWCVVGADFSKLSHLEQAIEALAEIKSTGKLGAGTSVSQARCAF